jgi:protein involved in sex pheromone biosynthesis
MVIGKVKMKFTLLVLVFVLNGCAQLMHGQEQPVIKKDAKNNIWYTTCSGAVENWYNCNLKAQRTCEKGFYSLEKTENANGGLRTMTFKCN